MDPIVAEFLVESEENLDRIEQELLELEKDPSQVSRITSIFRAIHTIKGTCGFLELRILESVTHVGENLLVLLRDGVIPLKPDVATSLLRLVDAVREMLRALKETGTDGDNQYEPLIEELNAAVISAGGSPGSQHKAPKPAAALQPVVVPAPKVDPKADEPPSSKRRRPPKSSGQGAVPSPASDIMVGSLNFEALSSQSVTIKSVPPPASKGRRPARSSPPSRRRSVAPSKQNDAAANSSQAGRGNANGSGVTIRVDVNVLEEMMTLVGELVLARNQLLKLTQEHSRTPLVSTCQRLDQITTELQSCAMKTRMQPIGTVWNKFPRVVRELAMQCKKRVVMDLQGSETELDKTVLEAISEPLTHILRNAVDHGIEYPSLRAALGKTLEGHIRLRAGHKGGHVIIEIDDDGAGIRVDKVKKKALQKGLITEAEAASMPDNEVFNLLFAPGFSTADKVTNISGRGVGMDVVRTKIERIGGSIEIKSRLDEGSTFCIRLPLTLAIVPAIVVSTGDQQFAIPQQAVQELLRISSSDQVEHVENAPVLRLRGRLLPLVWLSSTLGVQSLPSSPNGHQVVVLQAAEGSVGLVVDEIVNSEEIVVKPLSQLVSSIDCYAGCTILGDGRIALILEVSNVVARARSDSSSGTRKGTELAQRAPVTKPMRGFIVFQIDQDRYAVPLSQVERLEKLKVESLESCAGQAVLQYRGETIRVARFIDSANDYNLVRSLADDQGLLHAIICRSESQRTALVVTQVIDVVELEASEVHKNELVALGRVTTLKDVPAEFLPLSANDTTPERAYERNVA